MQLIHRSLLVAALLSIAACTRDATHAAPVAAEPTVQDPPPAQRMPAPVNAPAPADTTAPPTGVPATPPQEQPAPIVDPAPIEDSTPRPQTPPVDDISDEPTARELSITRCTTRVETLRTRVGELRTAVEKLGESATQELRDGLTALGDQLSRAETKLVELRDAAADGALELETELSKALDELDTAAGEFAKKLP